MSTINLPSPCCAVEVEFFSPLHFSLVDLLTSSQVQLTFPLIPLLAR